MTRFDDRSSEGPGRPEERLDPTKMVNQPTLRTSTGRIWLVMGGLFAAVVMIPFGLLIFAGDGGSRATAVSVGVLILVLYAAMIVCRLATRPGPARLRLMAACMITMAVVALLGVWLCLLVESAPLDG